MKKTILLIFLFSMAFTVFAQVLPRVGILPFEAAGPEAAAVNQIYREPSQADIQRAAALVAEELDSWGLMVILTGDQASTATYVISGQVAIIDNQTVLTATTSQGGRVLNNSRIAGASLNVISMESFGEQLTLRIPIPNFLQGTWQATLDMIDGPVTAIIQFVNDPRIVRVHRFDTWEHNGTNILRYQAIGSGTYSYSPHRRRTVNLEGRSVQSDAQVSIILDLEDALPRYTNFGLANLRVIFNENRDNFEFSYGALPFGVNFSGPSVHPDQEIFYTRFVKIPDSPYLWDEISEYMTGPSSMRVQAGPHWNRNLGNLALGEPFLQAESLVQAFADGSVRSFFMTGNELWNFDSRAGVTPYIARSVEGAAYISDASGMFRAVNRVGRELWRVNLGSPVTFPPVVGWDGRVFIPVGSQFFCRTASGLPLWSKDLGSPMAVRPMLDSAGSVVTVLENLDFVRLHQFSAEERIRLDERPALIASITSGYVLFYPNGRAEKIIYNEGAARGSRLSRTSFPSMETIPVAAAGRGSNIAVTLRDGRVQLLDDSGRVLWTGDSHESAIERGSASLDINHTAIEFDDRGIYIITTRGATAFTEDGRRRFTHKIDEAATIPGFSEEGMFYVSGRDNFIRAYKLDDRIRNLSRSRYYGPMPEGNYGLGNPPPSTWSFDPSRWDNERQQQMHGMIERTINSGQIGEDEPDFVGYLHEMIGWFLNIGHPDWVRANVLPMQHIAFIRLLGRMGSRDTVPFLWTIFHRHHEPAVRAAAAEAIGRIGVDPDGSAYGLFDFFLTPDPDNPNRDPQIVLSAAGAVADLSRFSGPPLAADGIALLSYFSILPWILPNTRDVIRTELDALYREGVGREIE